MTKDEFQKAVDDVIADCIRNNCSFGSYAYKVTEAVWPLLEAAEKERDDVAQQLVQSEIGKHDISEAHNAVTRRLSILAAENTTLRAKLAEMEQQEPVEWQCRSRPSWGDRQWSNWKSCSPGYAQDITKSPTLHDWQHEARPLYTLPGAKGEEKWER